MIRTMSIAAALVLALARPALAGPPYVSDDPETTDYGHFEIYAFGSGTSTGDGTDGEAGIDFNYGAGRDLQLTAVVPVSYSSPAGGETIRGFGNIELAAKYRFLHQESSGLDVAIFPRVFLPSLSNHVGERHAALFVPLWADKDWGPWSAFGGGGCALNRGDGSQDYCLVGLGLTRRVLPALTLGVEIYHQTADTRGGKPSTGVGAGFTYDLDGHYHLMASIGPGIQNPSATDRYSWYTALLFTF